MYMDIYLYTYTYTYIYIQVYYIYIYIHAGMLYIYTNIRIYIWYSMVFISPANCRLAIRAVGCPKMLVPARAMVKPGLSVRFVSSKWC